MILELVQYLGGLLALLVILLGLLKMGAEVCSFLKPRWQDIPKSTRDDFFTLIVMMVLYLASSMIALIGGILLPERLIWTQTGVVIWTAIVAVMIYRFHYLSASWTVIKMIIKPFKAEPPKVKQTKP